MKMHRLTSPQKFAAAFGRGINARAGAQTAMAILLSAALGSCGIMDKYNDFDLSSGSSKQDYENLEGRRAPAPQARGEEPPIPNFQGVLAAPTAPELADTRRVSIAVTETTPVRDILIELARKAQVDLELDPRISGGIIMTATDRPFIDVIARISELAELRYTFDRNVLKIQIDDPFLEQYRMDMLNLRRSATSSASSSTDAASAAQSIGGGGGGGGNNKSESSVSTTTTSDFWADIGKNIDQIMGGIQTRRTARAEGLNATFIPQAEKPAAAPAPAQKPAAAAPGGGGAGAAGGAAGTIAQAAALGNRQQQQQQQLDANLAMDKAGGAEPELAAEAGAKPAAAPSAGPSSYTLNPAAGIVTVFATQRQQKAIDRYLRDVRESIGQQVLIEAKVMEITLNDSYRGGIDWTAVLGPQSGLQNFNFQSNFAQGVPSDLANPSLSGTWTGAIISRLANGTVRNDLSLAAELVKQFGTTRTLSSPRLTVLNNQMAQLKVAQNQVFFQLQVNVTDSTATAAGKTTVQSQIKTVPVGLIMSVQPAVNPVTKRITLSLRPSITRITGFVNDPGVAITIAVARQNNNSIPTITSPIPIIEAREMDSIVTMDSGQTVVMGGLMQEEVQNSRQGVPGLMDIPLLGQAASQNIKQNKVTELVVFIHATLVNAPGTVSDEDIRLYKNFTPDPRPVVF